MPTPAQKRMLVKGSTLFVKIYLTLKSNHPALRYIFDTRIIQDYNFLLKSYGPDSCCVNRTYSRSS